MAIVLPVKKFPAFCWTEKCIVLFTWAWHWFPSWVRGIQSTALHFVSLRYILVVSSHLLLGLTCCLPIRLYRHCIMCIFLISSVLSTWLSHATLLDLVTLLILGKEFEVWSYSLWTFLQSAVNYCLIGSNTPQFLFLLTLFSAFLFRDINFESVFCQMKPTSVVYDLFNRFIITLTVAVSLRSNVFLMTREYTCLIISLNSGSKSRRYDCWRMIHYTQDVLLMLLS